MLGHNVINADKLSAAKSDEPEKSNSPDSKKQKKGINDEGDLRVSIFKPTFVQPEGYKKPERKSPKKTDSSKKTENKKDSSGIFIMNSDLINLL